MTVWGIGAQGRGRRATDGLAPRRLTTRRLRLLGVVSVVFALAGIGGGLALGLVTFHGVGFGSASTGTVTLAVNSQASHTCAYSNLEPGDLSGSSSQTCTFSVAYTGSIPAFLSLSMLVETKAGSGPGARPLYDPGAHSGLTMTVSDNQTPSVSYEVPTAAVACPTTAPAGSTCYAADNDLVSASAFTNGSPAVDFAVAPSFSTSVGNPYQGGQAAVVLSVDAVQAPANALPSGCNASTTGQPCPASGPFSWS